MKAYVYEISRISDGRIVYVGCTTNIKARRQQHRCKKYPASKYNIAVIGSGAIDEMFRKEKRRIRTLRASKEPLDNVMDHGKPRCVYFPHKMAVSLTIGQFRYINKLARSWGELPAHIIRQCVSVAERIDALPTRTRCNDY